LVRLEASPAAAGMVRLTGIGEQVSCGPQELVCPYGVTNSRGQFGFHFRDCRMPCSTSPRNLRDFPRHRKVRLSSGQFTIPHTCCSGR
jgi:hypothetical protein